MGKWKEHPLRHVVSARITDEEMKEAEALMEICHMPMSDVIRTSLKVWAGVVRNGGEGWTSSRS